MTADGVVKEMVKEDEELRAYPEANGYDVNQMGLCSEAATMVDDVASDEEGWLCLYKVSIPTSL